MHVGMLRSSISLTLMDVWSCTLPLLCELEAVPRPTTPPAAREPPTALLPDGQAGGHLGRVVR